MAVQPNHGRDIETDSMVCLYFGNPEECQSCGGWTKAGEGNDRGPFEGDPRFCSKDCFIDAQEFEQRQRRLAETNWCPECGFDNWEHAETCGRRVAEARGLSGRAEG